MKRTIFKTLIKSKANAEKDIDLINQFSKKQLQPDEVYAFSVVLCDNEIDRDKERFSDRSLSTLAALFIGKTGISDHQWSTDKQIARIYRTEVEAPGSKNSLGEPLRILRGDVYMLNSESNKPMIEAIEGGIVKEISVGCSIGKCVCSICGEPINYHSCRNGHIKGDTYDGSLCYGNLEEPTDAFEFSFVAVPAQRGAGVIKSAESEKAERERILAENKQFVLHYLPECREQIIEENKPFLKSEEKNMENIKKTTLDATKKGAFYKALAGSNCDVLKKAYEGLGGFPENDGDLGCGSTLLPAALASEIITTPVDRNTLRQVEPISFIRGLEEPRINFNIDDEELMEDVLDTATSKEIEASSDTVSYGRFKTKVHITVKDTVYHGSPANLAQIVDNGLRSALNRKEKLRAFALSTDIHHRHMSFYMNGIKGYPGDNIVAAVTNALSDLPDIFRENASVVMAPQLWYDYVQECTENGILAVAKPADIFGVPVVFNDKAVIAIVGDFNYAKQNYDGLNAILETDKNGKKGEYYYIMTAWGDHQTKLKSAFRLAIFKVGIIGGIAYAANKAAGEDIKVTPIFNTDASGTPTSGITYLWQMLVGTTWTDLTSDYGTEGNGYNTDTLTTTVTDQEKSFRCAITYDSNTVYSNSVQMV